MSKAYGIICLENERPHFAISFLNFGFYIPPPLLLFLHPHLLEIFFAAVHVPASNSPFHLICYLYSAEEWKIRQSVLLELWPRKNKWFMNWVLSQEDWNMASAIPYLFTCLFLVVLCLTQLLKRWSLKNSVITFFKLTFESVWENGKCWNCLKLKLILG